MKAFIVAVSSLCLCVILLCFLAYATGNFSIPKTTQVPPVATIPQQGANYREGVGLQATMVETDPLCSPCIEKMASILEIMESEWEVDVSTFLERPAKPSKPAPQGWVWLSSEQREKAKQLFDQYGTEEGLHRLREADPEIARQFERRRIAPPNLEGPDNDVPSTQ